MEYYFTGKTIFKEGDEGDCMYDVLDGKVGIYADYKKPSQRLLTTIEAGGFFGEMALIEGLPRTATAVALEGTSLEPLTMERFNGEFAKNNPTRYGSILLSVLANSSARLRNLTGEYMEACMTLSEYVAAEEKGEEKSPELIERMKKIARRGKKK